MRRAAFLLLSFLFSAFALSEVKAQLELPEDKVHWKFTVEQKGDEATIIGTITMEPKWHIYAANLPEGVFILATEINLPKSSNYKVVGGVIEPKPHFEHDDLTDEDLYYHSGTVKLKRKIKVLSEKDFKLTGTFTFQTCDDVKCLPPYSADFTVTIKGVSADQTEATNAETNSNDPVAVENLDPENKGEEADSVVAANNDDGSSSKEDEIVDDKKDGDKSLWAIFLLAFGSGFIALLTPCVFPMIPMTVSFFTKQSKTKSQGIKNASLYGLSIVMIYLLLGVIVWVTNTGSLLNEMSTNPWFNLGFFVLIIVFAVSFMGAFEIRMPNSWINKADSKADKGGIIGIFFMALVLALVSFSCTGPILGILLVGTAADGGGEALMMGMFGFGLALALPFTLFAAFPGWMNSMPQSGGWLNSVKVVLGFLELALAFKFLSNADLAWQMHLLEREVFLAIWIAIFGALALYLFGFLTLPHDSKVERLSVGRTLFGTFIFAFVIYMIPGMWGAPVKLINAFPPPAHYAESPLGVGGGGTVAVTQDEGSHDMHLGPQKLMIFDDYDKALKYAQEINKPLFVDFTGWNCVNCRKMEESVWGVPGIIEKLRENVVIVSLHVDERTELPKSEQKEVEVAGKKRKMITIGDKWMFKQINEYNIAAQPYYVMQDSQGKDLGNGSADFQNHSDPEKFKAWLNKGLELYKAAK